MWDFHYRVGGAIGTEIEPNNCPSGDGTGAPASQCTGAYELLHVTSTANIYMENVFLSRLVIAKTYSSIGLGMGS